MREEQTEMKNRKLIESVEKDEGKEDWRAWRVEETKRRYGGGRDGGEGLRNGRRKRGERTERRAGKRERGEEKRRNGEKGRRRG